MNKMHLNLLTKGLLSYGIPRQLSLRRGVNERRCCVRIEVRGARKEEQGGIGKEIIFCYFSLTAAASASYS
jgi:hypothetical protein